jgi:hypothetical protein
MGNQLLAVSEKTGRGRVEAESDDAMEKCQRLKRLLVHNVAQRLKGVLSVRPIGRSASALVGFGQFYARQE